MSPRFRRSADFDISDAIRVVLCDDVAAFRSLIRYALEDEDGIAVVGEAGDGLEGARLAAELRPDVVLLDLSMPECDGLEAIPLIRERAPDTAIVALSGFTAERMSGPVIGSGAYAYLEKGVDLSEIVAAIRDACQAAPA
jgi:DNA-binding NarL/FixJ family response regulator